MPRDPLPSPSELQIRHAEREDAAAVVRMIRRLAVPHGERAPLGRAVAEWDVLGDEPWATALVAEAGPALVGCAVFGRHYRTPSAGRCLDLGSLFVEPAWRGRGVGRALVEAVLRHARVLDCSRVVVGTVAADAPAQAFYERLGFAPAALAGPRHRALVSPALQGAQPEDRRP
ncbi:Predicted N-acetyltransferase YhbS [Tistlia consotensis]|uniref:Predicted N-acetyltransferase YhbS n=1 Tax=Tistlia consotensis USBA 355 TaxID=560819 RepID=A0A1Y6C949_9PROT|nr:GNAT family N-acetyltransferase [Tistlia consotensis]SMF43639.1 Predicted N-acetyltransferase YhbS [Tistlia consotensis USBA 355]SNR42798.1 Predicted N-acetyltransferase YhbS [Tistlia consotensis]